MTIELSSCGLIVKRFYCFGSYAFDSYIGFKFIWAIHDPSPAIVLRQVEPCVLVKLHWFQLGLLHMENTLTGRCIEINRALRGPMSFLHTNSYRIRATGGILEEFNVVASPESSIKKSGLVHCGGLTFSKGQTPTQLLPPSLPLLSGTGREKRLTRLWDEVKSGSLLVKYCCGQNILTLRKINSLLIKMD